MNEPNEAISRIFLIEDDVDDCEIFLQAIKEIAPHIEVVCTSDDDKVLHTMDKFQPNLVFINLHLPHNPGIDKLMAIHAHPPFRNIPVIIYTSWHNEAEIAGAIAAGAKLYVEKPASYSSLVAHLRTVLSLPWHTPEAIPTMHLKDGVPKTL